MVTCLFEIGYLFVVTSQPLDHGKSLCLSGIPGISSSQTGTNSAGFDIGETSGFFCFSSDNVASHSGEPSHDETLNMDAGPVSCEFHKVYKILPHFLTLNSSAPPYSLHSSHGKKFFGNLVWPAAALLLFSSFSEKFSNYE